MKTLKNFLMSIYYSFTDEVGYDKLLRKSDDLGWHWTFRFCKGDYANHFRIDYFAKTNTWYYRDCGLVQSNYVSFKEIVKAYCNSEYRRRCKWL